MLVSVFRLFKLLRLFYYCRALIDTSFYAEEVILVK